MCQSPFIQQWSSTSHVVFPQDENNPFSESYQQRQQMENAHLQEQQRLQMAQHMEHQRMLQHQHIEPTESPGAAIMSPGITIVTCHLRGAFLMLFLSPCRAYGWSAWPTFPRDTSRWQSVT